MLFDVIEKSLKKYTITLLQQLDSNKYKNPFFFFVKKFKKEMNLGTKSRGMKITF